MPPVRLLPPPGSESAAAFAHAVETECVRSRLCGSVCGYTKTAARTPTEYRWIAMPACVLAGERWTQVGGGLVEVLGELGDRVQVKADRGGRIVADLQILQHPLSKWGHSEAPFACDQTTKRNPKG